MPVLFLDRLIERIEDIATDYALVGERLLFWVDGQPIYVDGTGHISTDPGPATCQISLSSQLLGQFLDDLANPLQAYHQAQVHVLGDLKTAQRLYQAYFWS